MHLKINKLPARIDYNSDYLKKLYGEKGVQLIYKNSNNPYLTQKTERKFQFKYVVRTFNNLMNSHKKKYGSVEPKISPNFCFPNIKEYYGDNNNLRREENKKNLDNKREDIENKFSSSKLKNIPFYNLEDLINEKNNFKIKNINSNNFFEKSKSNTNIINNNYNLINEEKKTKTLFRNLSNGSLFEVCKKKYLASIRDFKRRNKMAENTFKEQLEKIKKEKVKKSKNEELFKEYEVKFNPDKFTESLKNEFQFFQDDDNKNNLRKKTFEESTLKIKKLFKDLNNNDKKTSTYYELMHNGLKPSQRIIQNILRREKKLETYEKSLIDLAE